MKQEWDRWDLNKMALSLIPPEEFIDSVPLRLQEQYTSLKFTGELGV